MSAISTDVSLSASLLHEDIREEIRFENRMIVEGRLLAKLLKETTTNFINQNMRAFDANPGDAACQLQAIKLRKLAQSQPLLQEAQRLQQVAQQLLQTLNERNGKMDTTPEEFFARHFEPVQISRDMLYLLRARLLTVTKVPIKTLSSGIVITQTNIGRLQKLSKGIDRKLDGEFRHLLLADAASKLSEHSIEGIQGIEKGLGTRDPLVTEMLTDKHIRRPVFDKRYPPKAFSCLFFQMQALLQHLKEENVVIAIKSIERDKSVQPTHHFLQASPDGFAFIDQDTIHPKTPLVVFEAVIEGDLRRQVEEIGFEKMILTCASQESPYDPKSSLDDVKNGEAQARILEFKAKAKELGLDNEKGTFFLLDHVFCNLKEKEL